MYLLFLQCSSLHLLMINRLYFNGFLFVRIPPEMSIDPLSPRLSRWASMRTLGQMSRSTRSIMTPTVIPITSPFGVSINSAFPLPNV